VTTAAPAPDAPDAAEEESLRSVLAALAANTAITAAKTFAAIVTGSAALLAEALHSAADAGNELFLIIALRRSGRDADELHPFGYGAERYFWALLAALGMFVVGGVVSVWRGFQELLDPSGVDAFWIGVVVLVISLVLDGTSRAIASAEVKRRAVARDLTVRAYVRESADPTITTVYLEDTADVIGAALALIGLIVHQLTDSAVGDAVASLMIGALLVYIATRLASRNRDLLTNQSVPARYIERLRSELMADPDVIGVPRIEAVYLGPGEVLVTGDIEVRAGADGVAAVHRLRDRARALYPVIHELYLTPVREEPA
jgi:cation diffusion facilitator family transporter